MKKKPEHPAWGGAREGSGPKPKKVHRIPLHVTVEEKTIEIVDRHAESQGITWSRAVDHLVQKSNIIK